MKLGLITFILSFEVCLIFAQSKGRIVDYTINDGLESNEALGALQDKYGFIWIAQLTSLARFDGYQFKNYKHQSDDSLMHLGPQSIGSLLLDEQGEIWINNAFFGRGNGYLLKYDYALDGFKKYKPDINAFIISLARESDSVVWIGTPGQGLYKFNLNNNKVSKFDNPFSHKGDRNANYIYNLHYRGSYLFLFTAQGIWKFDLAKNEFSRPELNPSDSSILNNASVFQADFRKDYVFQVNTDYAIVLDSGYNIRKKYDLPDEYRNSAVFNIFELDSDEKLWYVTEDGLNLYDTKRKSNELLTGSFGWANTTMIDQDNSVWMFGLDLGIKKFVRSELDYTVTKISDKKNSGPGLTGTIGFADNELSVLAGGNQRFDADLFVSNINDADIRVMPLNIQLKNGLGSNFATLSIGQRHVWVGSWAGGVYGFPYDKKKGIMKTDKITTYIHLKDNPYSLPSNTAPFVEEDTINNVLWVGSNNELTKIDLSISYGLEGSVQRFVHDESINSLSKGGTHDFEVERDGSIWILTGSGLDYLNKNEFTHVVEDRRLTKINRLKSGELLVVGEQIFKITRNNDKIETTLLLDYDAGVMVEDPKGDLWLLGKKGLSRYDRGRKLRIDYFNEFGPGLNGLVISKKGIIQLSQTPDLLITFNPLLQRIKEKNASPVLTSLLVNNVRPKIRNGPILPDGAYQIPANSITLEELALDYKHNNFTVEFSAMEMTAPEKNLYRHKLEGYDKDWLETDHKSRTATYTNLDPGTYTFRIKASNHHGVWSDNERTLKVVILPPPWRTWWAYSGYSLIVVGLLAWARGNIVQKERLKSNLQLAKLEQEKEHFELEKAKEVDKVKTSFFTNISHEFRTPLTLIKGPLQNILDNYKDDPKLQQQLKLVERNSDLLLKLINQLLDLAKLDAGNLKIEKSNCEVIRFVKATSSSFTSLAAQKNITINVDVPAQPCVALFDRDKLETILINLINNAIKFTPTLGKVNVSAGLNNNSLILVVRDTGIGIPEDQREKIFERFHQVSDSHKEVGTGIGLALVRELVSLLGGTISVKSEVGKGSDFTVTLPLEIVDASDTSGVETSTPEALVDQPMVHLVANKIAFDGTNHSDENESRPHVLVVEDNADLRSFVIESLGEEFFFLEAENGRQGFEVATTEIPDLIISDVMMPKMDGITMAEKIKTDVRTSHIPLILLTAKSTEASKLTGLESGADDYLTKPFNKQELLLKIRNGITKQRRLREKVMAELMSEAPRKEVLSADEQFLTKVKEEILKQLSNEQLSVESLAEQIGMSRVHLYRKISALTGISVNELIRKLRLHRAAQLLQQQWGPVSQIAYEVGFSNLSYFSKVFKEEFGVLPSEHKKVHPVEENNRT